MEIKVNVIDDLIEDRLPNVPCYLPNALNDANEYSRYEAVAIVLTFLKFYFRILYQDNDVGKILFFGKLPILTLSNSAIDQTRIAEIQNNKLTLIDMHMGSKL